MGLASSHVLPSVSPSPIKQRTSSSWLSVPKDNRGGRHIRQQDIEVWRTSECFAPLLEGNLFELLMCAALTSANVSEVLQLE